jgi:putative acetyltransferase
MNQPSLDLHKLTIRREDFFSAAAWKLIDALNKELTERYPEEGANHFRLDAEEVEEGRGGFFIAFIGSQPFGCGAIRLIDSVTAEIKRMYIIPKARGLGLGLKLLMTLENEAVRLGASRLVLETGDRQPEALRLYKKAGFVSIPAFGEYMSSPLSVCMGKDL